LFLQKRFSTYPLTREPRARDKGKRRRIKEKGNLSDRFAASSPFKGAEGKDLFFCE